MNRQMSSDRLSLLSLRFCRAYVTTMRPYLLFISGITGIAGMSFAERISDIQASLIFAASFLSYGFGQALTDCFQTDTDTISAPYRPLTQGIITKGQVLSVSLVGLAGCAVVFGLLYPMNFLLGVLGALGLASYTFFKRRWWGGPFYNAWIVAVLFTMAFLAAKKEPAVSLPIVLAGFAAFFGYSNFVLSGYFKDIEADRRTGYRTLPVVFGRRIAAWTCDLFALLTGLFGIGALVSARRLPSGLPVVSLIFLLAGITATVFAQIRLHKVNTDAEAHTAIGRVIYGYVFFLAGVASAMKPSWTLPLACFCILFAVTLAARPARNQI